LRPTIPKNKIISILAYFGRHSILFISLIVRLDCRNGGLLMTQSHFGIAISLLLFASPSSAQELPDLHEQHKERGLVCMVDHYHYGSSSGKASKAEAVRAAIQSWVDFVNFEYGSGWTSWNRSGTKSVNCTNGGSGNWGCDVNSRPCRR